MAGMNDTSATKALNEDAYINQLYDDVAGKQKRLLEKNYLDASASLTQEEDKVRQQTTDNLNRTHVEAQRAGETFGGSGLSAGAQQHAALSLGNQKQKNVTTIRDVQSEADSEIQRQRDLLGQQYAAAIKKAQADNDMARAQALYEAAAAEDAQLLALQKDAGALMAENGDNSILTALLGGYAPTRDTAGETWEGVRKNEERINQIYDSAAESEKQAAQMELNESLSTLNAQQEAARKQTDQDLTQTYVDALKSAKNNNEVQNAYGTGSGTAARIRLARELGLTEDLTALRGVQMGTDAKIGQQRFAAGQTYRDTLLNALQANEQSRAQALYDAAEGEEQALVGTQKNVGSILAGQGDYSVLGRLYGLTQDQIDRLQGTGAYAPEETYGPAPESEEEVVTPPVSPTISQNLVPDGYVSASLAPAYNYLVDWYKKATEGAKGGPAAKNRVSSLM